MPTEIRVPLDFRAARRKLLDTVSESTGVNLDEYVRDVDRLNDALSDVFASLWLHDEATIALTLFTDYLPYAQGDARNAPPTPFACRLVAETPGPLPQPGDATVPWLYSDDDLEDIETAIELPLCRQLDIDNGYDAPGLRDQVQAHLHAAYQDVRRTGQGLLRFDFETPTGSKLVALRLVRRAAIQ